MPITGPESLSAFNSATSTRGPETMNIKQRAASVPLLLLCLLLAAPVSAADNHAWSASDTALQATFILLTAMEWRQTREFTNHRSRYSETYTVSPFLSEHPTAHDANRLAAASIIVHTGLAYALPRPYRTIWQSFWIGVQGGSVLSNYVACISVRF